MEPRYRLDGSYKLIWPCRYPGKSWNGQTRSRDLGKGAEAIMDRPKFLRTTGTLLAGASLDNETLRKSFDAEPASENRGGRLVLPINQNWRFSERVVERFESPQFDDSKFESVTIPHTNKRLPWHSFDEKSYQFVSAYRRSLRRRPRPSIRSRTAASR